MSRRVRISTFSLSPDLPGRIALVASATGHSKSKIVSLALDEWLSQLEAEVAAPVVKEAFVERHY